MAQQERKTQSLDEAEVKERWSELVGTVARQGNRVIVEHDGQPLAAIISAEDLTLLREFEEARERRWAAFRAIGHRNADLDSDEIERDVSEAIAEMRAEQRMQRATASDA